MEAIFKTSLNQTGSLEDLADKHESRQSYAKSLGLVKNMAVRSDPILFINGHTHEIGEFNESMVKAYKAEIGDLQQLVFKQEIKDDITDLYGYLLKTRKALNHRHPLFNVPHQQMTFLDLSKLTEADLKQVFNAETYLHPTKNPRLASSSPSIKVTITVFLAASKRHEFDLVHQVCKFLDKTEQPVRIRLLFMNRPEGSLKSALVSYREILRGHFEYEKYANFLERSIIMRRQQSSSHLKQPGKNIRKTRDYETSLEHYSFASNLLRSAGIYGYSNNPMIFVNGKFFCAIKEDDPIQFTADHFESLVKQELEGDVSKVMKVRELNTDEIVKAIVFQHAANNALQNNFGTGQHDISFFPTTLPDLPNFKIKSSPSMIHVTAVLDPLSMVGQRYANILSALSDKEWLSCQTWLNPTLRLAHFPLPAFYRYAKKGLLELEISSNYAVQLDTPAIWDTAIDDGSSDPDNIMEATDVYVRMKVRNLIVEAKFETGAIQSLGGLTVVAKDLISKEEIEQVPIMGDINVAQFHKLTSRLWYLEVEASESFELQRSPAGIVSSSGRDLFHLDMKELQKTPLPLSELTKVKGSTRRATINVFSIASGSMYERLIRIMMTSVMKRTNETIKFWLIDTFVTPEFRKSVAKLSKHYDFEYEFISIRWPVWLRRQFRKHRTVWAYKVLFLDQLFPSDIDRIIYVDADQIVRSDLSELMKINLNGAPWGFVPFCDSRKETDGFRFWKNGYWKEVLSGKPYHISALFVVDMKKLRASGQADRLRRDYHMLSVDPNSLANLDQDLPNHMQDEFPICSLPQEWLWCETWCSDETKLKAKSIDLCNYPGRKETKIEQGMRLIPEWKDYDHEVDFILKTKASFPEKSDL